MTGPGEAFPGGAKTLRLFLASSNAGKLREYRALAAVQPQGLNLALELFPDFAAHPSFEESASTFAENAAGKALHYSRFTQLPVMADDSGLVVPALDGAPGVYSARYAGVGASDAQRMAKLKQQLEEKFQQQREEPVRVAGGENGAVLDRSACFVCVIALATQGRVTAVLSDNVCGEILHAPRGAAGFGYDPMFLFPPLGKTFAELSEEEKNLHSHRGKAFRKMLEFLATMPML